jgi:hypothetical protein
VELAVAAQYNSGRMWLLIALAVCVFLSTVLSVLRVLPGPLEPLDYFVVGAVSVLVALTIPFMAVSLAIRARGHRRADRVASSDPNSRT